MSFCMAMQRFSFWAPIVSERKAWSARILNLHYASLLVKKWTQLTDLQTCLDKKVWCRDPEWINGWPRAYGSKFFGDPTHAFADRSWRKSLLSRTSVTKWRIGETKRRTTDSQIEFVCWPNSQICRPVLEKKVWCHGPEWLNGGPSTHGLKFVGDPTHGFADLS